MKLFTPFRPKTNDPNLSVTEIIPSPDQPNIWNFNINATNLYSANYLRRILKSQIPSLAINNILVNNNSSHVYDGDLASRLGLIPIKSEISMFDIFNQFDTTQSKNLKKHFCIVSLNVICPKDSIRDYIVTSKDITFDYNSGTYDFKNLNIGVVNDDIVICRLKPGQSILLNGSVQIGASSFETFKKNERSHAKWTPVNTCSFISDLHNILDDTQKYTEDEIFKLTKMNVRRHNKTVGISQYDNQQLTFKCNIEINGAVDIVDIILIALKLYKESVN